VRLSDLKPGDSFWFVNGNTNYTMVPELPLQGELFFVYSSDYQDYCDWRVGRIRERPRLGRAAASTEVLKDEIPED